VVAEITSSKREREKRLAHVAAGGRARVCVLFTNPCGVGQVSPRRIGLPLIGSVLLLREVAQHLAQRGVGHRTTVAVRSSSEIFFWVGTFFFNFIKIW
jgi:hypothetical protein